MKARVVPFPLQKRSFDPPFVPFRQGPSMRRLRPGLSFGIFVQAARVVCQGLAASISGEGPGDSMVRALMNPASVNQLLISSNE